MSINLSVFITENTKQYIAEFGTDRKTEDLVNTITLSENRKVKLSYDSNSAEDCELFIISDIADIKKYALNNVIGYVLTKTVIYKLNDKQMNYGPHSQFMLYGDPPIISISALLSLFVDKIYQTVLEYQLNVNLIRKSVELQSKNVTGIKGIDTLICHNIRQSRISNEDSFFFDTYKIDKIVCMKWDDAISGRLGGDHYIYFQTIKLEGGLEQFYDQIKKDSNKRTVYLALIQGDHQKCREWCLKNKIWVLPQVRLAVIHEFTNQTATSKYPSSSIIEKAVEQINNLRLISRITKDTGDENSLLSSIKALELSPEQLKL